MSTFIEQNQREFEDSDLEPKRQGKSQLKQFLRNKFIRAVIIVLILGTVCPTIAYFYVISKNIKDHSNGETYSCLVVEEYRIPCGNEGISKSVCEDRKCCYNSTTSRCHHYLPSQYFYKPVDDGFQPSQTNSPVGSVNVPLKLTIQKSSSKQLSIIIHDETEDIKDINLDNTEYLVNQSSSKLLVTVLDADGDTIFNTEKSALIASKNYWEWSFQIDNSIIFGLDRNLIQLSSSNDSLVKVIYSNKIDHASAPTFWAYKKEKFHGIRIRHQGPLEIEILPSNVIILRSLLGKSLEIELTLGPGPQDVFKNQIGEALTPPQLLLETHNCKEGTSTTLKELLAYFEDSEFGIECVHQNLFMALQNSTNYDESDLEQLQEILTALKNDSKSFYLALPPHILKDQSNSLYTVAKNLDILYKTSEGEIYEGSYLGLVVVYPDFSSDDIATYIDSVMEFIDKLIGTSYIDGYLLVDNWPQDDSNTKIGSKDFPYLSKAIINQMTKTLPWNVIGANSIIHLESHNSYGEYQKSALEAYFATDDQKLVITASKIDENFWPQIVSNVNTTWESFNLYLDKILFSSITGNQMVGMPICGDSSTYNVSLQEDLCLRWYGAASTLPFFRVSSALPYRDPANLYSKYVKNLVDTFMSKRALLNEYFYTLLSKSEPMVRPMFYEYYKNKSTFYMNNQYMLGEDLLVAHPLSSGAKRLQVFLPPSKGVWYEFWGGTMFNPPEANIDLFEPDLIIFVAEGKIIPLTNSNEIQLYIALNCTKTCEAQGELLLDGQNLAFSATNDSVIVSNLPKNCQESLVGVRLYGYDSSSGFVKLYSFADDEATLCPDDSTTRTFNFET